MLKPEAEETALDAAMLKLLYVLYYYSVLTTITVLLQCTNYYHCTATVH